MLQVGPNTIGSARSSRDRKDTARESFAAACLLLPLLSHRSRKLDGLAGC